MATHSWTPALPKAALLPCFPILHRVQKVTGRRRLFSEENLHRRVGSKWCERRPATDLPKQGKPTTMVCAAADNLQVIKWPEAEWVVVGIL